jgi:hypothetical protein
MKVKTKLHAFKLAVAVSSILVFVEALGAARRF